MVKFSEGTDTGFQIIFDLTVDGLITDNDVIGCLLNPANTFFEDFALTKLQKNKKIGKLQIELSKNSMSNSNLTAGIISFSTTLNKADASLLIAILERISRVGLFNASLKLKNIRKLGESSKTQILNRAKTIYFQEFEQLGLGDEETKLSSIFNAIIDGNRPFSLGSFTVGSTFYSSNIIILVEGRADVNILHKAGVNNVIGVNGYSYNYEELAKLLENKVLYSFCDSDKGGRLLTEKLNKDFNISTNVRLPPNISVEDLTPKEVQNILKENKINF